MFRAKPRKISIIFGLYISATMVLFSMAILVWTYKTSVDAIERELINSFEQSHSTTETIFDRQIYVLENELREIAANDYLSFVSSISVNEKAREVLIEVVEDLEDSILDVVFLVSQEEDRIVNASSSFFDTDLITDEIATEKDKFLSDSGVIRIQKNNVDLTLILKALRIIDHQTGRVSGTLIGGVVLNDNLSILESIVRNTKALSAALYSEGELIASADLSKSEKTQILREAVRMAGEGELYFSRGYIASYRMISLNQGRNIVASGKIISDKRRYDLQVSYLQKSVILAAFFGLFIFFTIAAIRKFTLKSLHNLIEYSSAVSSGDMKKRYNTGRVVELNQVGRAMEDMVTDLKKTNEELSEKQERLKQSETAIKESHALLESLIDSIPDLIFYKDSYGKYLGCNRSFTELVDCPKSEVVGKNDGELLPVETANFFRDKDVEILIDGNPTRREAWVIYPNGRKVLLDILKTPYYDNDGKILGLIGISRDITEARKSREMVIQSEKMLSVGGLAAGMAHEINNPLAGIMQNIQVIQNRISPGLQKNIKLAEECGTQIGIIEKYFEKRGLSEMLSSVMEAGKRAAKIVENMLSFSRQSDAGFAEHDLRELLDTTLELSASDYDLKKRYDFKKIKILKEYEKDLPDVYCEGSKIQQVFLNILKNGAQAMAQVTDRPSEFILRIRKDLDKVRIEIEDNGPGMPEEVRRRIFEPFFTTKGEGLGTGLGLSVSYFIITDNHGGDMYVETTNGKGAVFIITLPVNN